MDSKLTSASLYVGGLLKEVNEEHLYHLFETFKFDKSRDIATIRVCRDKNHQSLGYAYVNFFDPEKAQLALDIVNNQPVHDKPCRIMWSQRDPSLRRSGVGNIFIKNLHESITHKDLFDTFSQFGNILSCEVALDEKKKSKGYGFVHFEKAEDAESAISTVNDKEIEGKKVYVGRWQSKKERMQFTETSWTNVYIKNIPPEVDEEQLRKKFTEFGSVLSVKVARNDDESKSSKGFGFVNFQNHSDAVRAVQNLHQQKIWGDKEIWCCRHKKKAERQRELRSKQVQVRNSAVNLYVKNLAPDVDSNKLAQDFKVFGDIKSCMVAEDEKGNSKGFGFICFKSHEEAKAAIEKMNGVLVPGLYPKYLYVAFHETKDLRRAKLAAQFRNEARKRMYPYPYSSYGTYAPYIAPQQHIIRRAQHWPQHPHYTPAPYTMPVAIPPQVPSGRGRYPPQRPARTQPQQGGRGRMPYGQEDMGTPFSYMSLSQLMTLPEDQRKLSLGDQLYPLIQKIEPDLCGKITGMLLDSRWGIDYLYSLIEDRQALAAKVHEARVVLERAQATSGGSANAPIDVEQQ